MYSIVVRGTMTTMAACSGKDLFHTFGRTLLRKRCIFSIGSLQHASTTCTAPDLLVRGDDKDGIATLTLNRPSRHNSLSLELLQSLQSTLDSIRTLEANKTHIVILQGAGDMCFSAGHDLKEMRDLSSNPEELRELFQLCSSVMMTIRSMPQIVIAQVQGMATAAGCQLVCACDLAVCSDDAQFGVSGIRVGLFCATPSVELSRTVVHSKHSLRMLLTGDFISAETARQYGIVNTIVPSEQLHDATRYLAESIVEKSAVAVRLGKDLFYKQREAKSVPEAYDMATECMVSNVMHSSQDVTEGIDAFLEKRKPTWQSK